MLENLTWGAELEIADWNVSKYGQLMEEITGAKVNKREKSVMNSSGISNDPYLTTCIFGGEINTRVTNSIEEQISHILHILQNIGKYSLNYSCALQIHVGIPGLKEDLNRVKKYATWIFKNQTPFYNAIVRPKSLWTTENLLGKDLKRFIKKEKSFKHSRGAMIPLKTITDLEACDKSDFKSIRDCFYRKSKRTGRILPMTNVRTMIHLAKMFKGESDSIEFRCFNITDKEDELWECFNLVLNTIECIERGGVFEEISFDRNKIPPASEFKMEKFNIYQRVFNSNFDPQYFNGDGVDAYTRGKVLKELIKEGKITVDDLGVPLENLNKPVIFKW